MKVLQNRALSKRILIYFFFILTTFCSAEDSSGTRFVTNNSIPYNNSENSSDQNTSPFVEGGTSGNNYAGTIVAGNGGPVASSSTIPIGNNATAPTDTCADKSVQVGRISPWVLFVIDRSSSMSQPYPGSTNRWQAIYDALMDPDVGIIPKLQGVVRFGVMLYDGEGICPRLVTVEPAPMNYTAIDAVYGPAQPGIRTPTALALNEAYKLVSDPNVLPDGPTPGKQFVVLCTDGEPNGCAEFGGFIGTDFQGPIDEVTAAANQDIKTYVVSVASGGQEYQNFLEELARIGNTGSPAFNPTTKDDLIQQFSDIVGGAIGCEVELNGKVKVGSECLGYVELNSTTIECNSPDGWKLKDESHIELLGDACELFINDPNVILNAKFPCDVVDVE